jgi:autotransporter translocation and assembly factor TamB
MKKILRIFAAIFFIFILMLSASFFWLQTANGKNWIVTQIPKYIPGITVSGLEGSVPGDMRLAGIKLYDRQGEWLEIEDVHLSWHPLELLRGKWRIDALEISRLHMLRPEVEEKQETAGSFSLPSIPDIKFKKIEIGEIILEPVVAGSLQRFTVSGGSEGNAYKLTARSLEGPETILKLLISRNWDMDAQLSEAQGGLIGAALKLPEGASVNANLKAVEDEDAIKLTTAEINIGSTAIKGSGSYAADKISGHFIAATADISEFSALTASELSGALNTDITISGSAASPKLEILANSERLLVNGKELLAPDIQAKLDGNDFTINGSTNYNKQAATLDIGGKYKDQELDISAMKAAYGPYNFNGTLKTNLKKQEFSARLELEPAQLETAKVQGRFQAAGSFEEFKGDISGNIASEKESLSLSSSLQGAGDIIKFDNIKISGSGIDIKGNVEWLKERAQAEGQLLLSAPDLRPLGRLLATPLEGKASGAIKLTPGNDAQQAKINIDARSILIGSTKLEELLIQAEGDEKSIAANVKTNGLSGDKPFIMNLAANGTRSATETIINLQSLNGAYAGEPVLLKSPSRLLISGAKTEVTPTTIKIAGGNIQMQGTAQNGNINAGLKTTKLQLEKLPVAGLPQGILQASLTVKGDMAKPRADFSVNCNLQDGDLPLTLALNGTWQGKILSAKGSATKDNDKLISAKAELIAPLSLSPVNFGVSAETPLKGNVSVDAPLGLANRYIYSKGMHIDGRFSGTGTLSGKLGAPVVNGTYNFSNVNFDHQDSGICLRNAKSQLVANGTSLVLKNFTSSAQTGSINANVGVRLDGDQSLSGNIAFVDFPLFCGGTAKGIIDGKLEASGTLLAAKIAGALTLGPLNVQLPGKTPGQAEIPKVKTVFTTDKPVTESPARDPVILDISLNAPNRVFVRGRGLDAEFSGNLHITGAATSPYFEGSFKATHGLFTMLDRELKLTSANIQFGGQVPPSPFLDVVAETKVQDTTIQVNLSGQAKNPDFSFSSTPSLPKDEILALLLFGRNLSSLTPFQAISLAQSVAELSGESSGPGILGTIRNTLGVDRLDVDTDANNNVTVGAGKYISEKIYVGVTQGATPEDRAVTTEIEVSPRISATSSMDAQGNQGVGLQWKYDY